MGDGSSSFLTGGALAPQDGGAFSAQGPGAASAGVIEGLLADAGAAQDASVKREAEKASPVSLSGNAATSPALAEATEGTGLEGPTKFKDLSKGGKFAAILKVLGEALAVSASNDPGAAVAAQLSRLSQERELLNARRSRATERRAENKFARDQFTTEVQSQVDRDNRLARQRAEERVATQQFDLSRDLDNFMRESGFRREEAEATREFQRAERSSLRASEQGERRQQRISELTLQLSSNLVSAGSNAEGQRDPLSRSRRVAEAIIDDNLESLSDADNAAVEFMLRKHTAESPGEQQSALIQAASRLIGKPQPVPETRQLFNPNGTPVLDENNQPQFEIVRDPATGAVVPKVDALGNVVEVPMSKEEALSFVAFGMEEREFFEGREPDPQEVARAEQAQSIVVDPAQIQPEHLLDSEGRVGLINAIAGHAATGEERRELLEQFEEEMKARGFGSFSPAVKKVLEAHFKERDDTSRLVGSVSRIKARSEEMPAIRALRQTGFNEEADRRSGVNQ
jgi:hypothetical protein